MCEDNNEQLASGAHSQRHETLLGDGVGVLARQRTFVEEDGSRLGEGDAVLTQVCFGLLRVPLDIDPGSVWTFVLRSNRRCLEVASQ